MVKELKKLMTVDLEKRLVANKKKEMLNSLDQFLCNEANKLSNDASILRAVGFVQHFQTKSNLEQSNAKLSYIYSIFDKNRIFKESEIKNLCLLYRLRFLQLSSYRGELDSELPSKLRELELKVKKLEPHRTYMQEGNFKICAPAEMFFLKEKPESNDPLLFYYLGTFNGEKIYYLVHKWGNDISIKRLIKGFFNRNSFTQLFMSLVLAISSFSLLMSLNLFPIEHADNVMKSALLSVIFFGIVKCLFFGESINSNDVWDLETKSYTYL